jgi:hypothetical protein
MAETAYQKQYRDEYIHGYEVRQSLLRDACTTEAVISGNEAVFLVGDSGGAEAVTRGVNGLIPGRADNNNQYTATLSEWHDKPQKTRFNIFASQGNQRSMMQTTSMGVINRRVDKTILTELSTATQNLGTAATMTEALALRAKTVLQINDVPWDNNIFAIISPAAEAYLMQVDSFSSSDYVDTRPMVDAPFAWNDQVKFRNWLGINWVSHPGITGVGTNAEKCYMFHKSAIGHAMDTEGMNVSAGYNEEDDYSYARTSVFEGAQLLQNSGVVVINHDGSAYTAA